jgi:hypothetical protein
LNDAGQGRALQIQDLQDRGVAVVQIAPQDLARSLATETGV